MSPLTATMDPGAFAPGAHIPTPCLLLDLQEVERNVEAIRAAIPGVDVGYALKCNPQPEVVATLAQSGVGFEIASAHELSTLLTLGIPASRMMCLHPIKAPGFVQQLHRSGVDVLAVDSREEIEKVARLAPGCRIVVRIETDGRGSRVPLGGKFGCSFEEAVELSRAARLHGLRPAGITMHVGSQCEEIGTWKRALQTCKAVCTALSLQAFPVEIISLGGGLPVPYTENVPGLAAIGRIIGEADLRRHGTSGCRITIEPGRAIVASAGTMLVSVVGTAMRGGLRWVYLDAGIYGGLFEWLAVAGALTMPILSERESVPMYDSRLAGPTCDSIDVLPGIFHLPALEAGDRIAFRHAGAYSTALTTRFNGFEPPSTVVIDRRERAAHA